MTVLGSLSIGHDVVSIRQSESSRRTHLSWDLEKKSPGLQVREKLTPSRHKVNRVHECSTGCREVCSEGQSPDGTETVVVSGCTVVVG